MSNEYDIPDPTQVVTWPGATVAVVIVVALLIWPGLLAWINSRAARAAAEDARHQVNPNSGKSMADAVNRIEATQTEQGKVLVQLTARLDRLEKSKRWWRIR